MTCAKLRLSECNDACIDCQAWAVSQLSAAKVAQKHENKEEKYNFSSIPQAVILQCRDSKKGAFWQFCNNVTVLQCYIQYLVKILQNCYKSVTNSVKTRYTTNRNYFTRSCPVCFLGENSHLSGRKVAVKSEFHACKVRVSVALKLPSIKHW